MKALSVLYAGALAPEAFAPIPGAGGKSAFALALEKAGRFPGTSKLVLLGGGDTEYRGAPPESDSFAIIRRAEWKKSSLLEQLARLSAGYDFAYYAWADCPFLDPGLADKEAGRHLGYAAEYSYADGWPYGFAPELLSPGTAGILSKILRQDDGPVERDSIFQVLQKDINSFDIETEISPVDLRLHRLTLAADSKRNLLLVGRLMEAGLKGAGDIGELIEKKPGLLRGIPAFFPIQVFSRCPQSCSLCPYPRFGPENSNADEAMSVEKFTTLLDKIIAFSGDGVIGLSLWGELSLHPQKIEIAGAVLERKELSLVIETSGLGWKESELESLAEKAEGSPKRTNTLCTSPLSWIVSLDAADPERYRKVRGAGFAEASGCAKKLSALFPGSLYVQALRVQGSEDDIEQFYHYWNSQSGTRVIIQKYDNFCGALPQLEATDLSPLKRQPCWHIMRDMPVLLDGSVPSCREDLAALKTGAAPGNVFSRPLEEIWERSSALYLEHARSVYPGICKDCDEYYTYNF
jgi:spiro-SPASM protein